MRRLKMAGMMFLAFVPLTIHYAYIAPLLWSHQSSAAFELNLFLWIVVLALPLWACAYQPKQQSAALGEGDRK